MPLLIPQLFMPLQQKMEQLCLIIQQRKQAILQITKNHEDKHKFQLIQEERKRNDRENWILRILKTLKLLTVEQKKIIYDTTVKMMNHYQKIEANIATFEAVNFLEVMINLFVDFFNQFQSMDFTHLKAIIRPNNNYMIVDLLKSLIDIGRKEFKNTLQEHFKETFNNATRKLSVRSLTKLPVINVKSNEEPYMRGSEEIKQSKMDVRTKLKYSLFERYGRVIDNCNFEQMYQRVNQLYFDLMYANQRNSSKIQKYLDSCFGAKRHINYDASGLYTQEEIRKLVKDQKQKATLRLSQMKELKGQCTSEQLKEYFKMKVEFSESTSSIPDFAKHTRIQEWFPFCLVKLGDKLHPYKLLVEMNGNYSSILEFQERFGKRIRIYMRELLSDTKWQDFDPKIFNDLQYLQFKRKNTLQHNYTKLLQFLNEQPHIKREVNLPTITNSQQQPLDNRRKIKSQSKLPNRTVIMPVVKSSHVVNKQVEKRLNYSSIVKDMHFGTRRKIDTLIEHYIKFTK